MTFSGPSSLSVFAACSLCHILCSTVTSISGVTLQECHGFPDRGGGRSPSSSRHKLRQTYQLFIQCCFIVLSFRLKVTFIGKLLVAIFRHSNHTDGKTVKQDIKERKNGLNTRPRYSTLHYKLTCLKKELYKPAVRA